MKFSLGTTEMLDWQECWCFRCERDHAFSHFTNDEGEGCPHLLNAVLGNDDPVFEARGDDAFIFIPANVVCADFTPCTLCPPDDPNAERRQGETRAEFHDRMRAETLALPRTEVANG